ERGEIVGFLGPNGAGKTTTLRMLTGFLPPSAGTISVAGHDILRDSLAVRQTIGYLPESVPLYAEHRVEEMLLFQGRLHGLARKEAQRRGAEVLARVGLAERARTPIGKLSKGQRQRVGLAVALLPDPDVLILDEPTSGLDPLQRIEVRGLVQELAERRTVLLSSHILPEIEAICPRVIVLHQGRVAADGTPGEMLADSPRGSFVRLEAMVGFDPAAPTTAMERLRSLGGVLDVRDLGALGIYRGFEIVAQSDLREDVGALAMQSSWAVRELSWHAPTLEELFTRIALGLGDGDDAGATPGAVAVRAPESAPSPSGLPVLDLAPPEAAPPAPRVLNPFAAPSSDSDA
ncbi:MAG: ABC transporter ATP-binding protein, partial [Planctomycetota bacterium]